MKSLHLTMGLIVLLLVNGCQHAVLSSSDMQQKFFHSLKASNSEAERAIRAAQYHSLVGRFDLAQNELGQAVANDPHNVRLLNALGNCYDKLGQYAKGREIYEKALANDSDNCLVKNNLGYSCYLSGDLSRAEKIFQEILSKNPGDTLAQNNLGLIWCRQGKENEALRLWQKTEGEITAREKLHQVLAYLGKSGNQVGKQDGHNNYPEPAAALQSQAKPPEKNRQIAATGPEKNPTINVSSPPMAAGPANLGSKNMTGLTGKLSPEPQVKVEEVKMIVQPATYTRTNSEETDGKRLIPTPPTAPSQNEKSVTGVNHRPIAKECVLDADLLEDEVETPAPPPYYRRPRQWRCYPQPKIVTPNPLPAESRVIKNSLSQELIYQNQNAPGRQDSVF